jgi:hypothetical protein
MTAWVHHTTGGSVEAEGLDRYEIAEGLRAWAQGSHPVEAAIELLIGHGSWLERPEFRALLWVEDDVVGLDPAELAGMALLAPASSSELAMVQLAVELLGIKTPDSLDRLLAGLDASNTGLVLEAIARCTGTHEQHQAFQVTGRFFNKEAQ